MFDNVQRFTLGWRGGEEEEEEEEEEKLSYYSELLIVAGEKSLKGNLTLLYDMQLGIHD